MKTVYDYTEGHPLFVANLFDEWAARDLIRLAEARWGLADRMDEFSLSVPQRLRVLIEQRIDALSPVEQRLLAAASLAGEEWSAALVAAALNMDWDAVDECCEALAERGQMIAQAGITEWPDGTVAGRYRFLHALYEDFLYQRLAAAQRLRFHKRLAERLAVAYGEQSHQVAAELADHFERGCDYARAVRYLGQAAENAARRYANREAVAYLSRALALVERLPPAEQEGTRVGLLQRRAHVWSVMDDLDSAIADLKLVLRSGRERNDQEFVVKTLVQISRFARWFDSRYCLETAAEAETVSREISDDLINACARVNYARVKLNFAMLNSTGWRQDSVAICRSGFGVIRKARDRA
ncbi:MAG: transcriptional regulator, partial [Gammaproteobacteria bacterium]